MSPQFSIPVPVKNSKNYFLHYLKKFWLKGSRTVFLHSQFKKLRL